MSLVTLYTGNVQQRITDNYAKVGVEVVAERHLDICFNHDFALVEPEMLRGLFREVARAKPQAITTLCTNLHAARLAEALESELDIPLLDTVSATVWAAVRAEGADPASIRG